MAEPDIIDTPAQAKKPQVRHIALMSHGLVDLAAKANSHFWHIFSKMLGAEAMLQAEPPNNRAEFREASKSPGREADTPVNLPGTGTLVLF